MSHFKYITIKGFAEARSAPCINEMLVKGVMHHGYFCMSEPAEIFMEMHCALCSEGVVFPYT